MTGHFLSPVPYDESQRVFGRDMSIYDAAPDGYLRITVGVLHSLELSYLDSAIDPSIAVPAGMEYAPGEMITGYSEWAGSHGKSTVSIGWDWGLVRELLVVLNPAEIRTNLLLVNEQGYDESPLFSRVQILQRIELLPWREDAMEKIRAAGYGR